MKAIIVFLILISTTLFLETAVAFSPFLARSKSTPSSTTTTSSQLEANKDDGNLFDDDLFKDNGHPCVDSIDKSLEDDPVSFSLFNQP